MSIAESLGGNEKVNVELVHVVNKTTKLYNQRIVEKRTMGTKWITTISYLLFALAVLETYSAINSEMSFAIHLLFIASYTIFGFLFIDMRNRAKEQSKCLDYRILATDKKIRDMAEKMLNNEFSQKTDDNIC